MTSYGQILLKSGSAMNFVGNRGSLGSALVVESRNAVNSLTRTAHNPLCFLRYDTDPLAPPSEWKEVNEYRQETIYVRHLYAYVYILCICRYNELYFRVFYL